MLLPVYLGNKKSLHCILTGSLKYDFTGRYYYSLAWQLIAQFLGVVLVVVVIVVVVVGCRVAASNENESFIWSRMCCIRQGAGAPVHTVQHVRYLRKYESDCSSNMEMGVVSTNDVMTWPPSFFCVWAHRYFRLVQRSRQDLI